MRSLLGAVFALVLLSLVVIQPRDSHSRTAGSAAGFSGGPATGGQDCSACHFSFDVNSGSGSVSVKVDASGPIEVGEEVVFTITVDNTTVAGSPRQGFQLSVESDDGAHEGTILIIDADNTRFSEGSTTYAAHTLAGSGLTTWQVGWRATDAPGKVTVYVAGNAADNDGGIAGDYIYTATLPLQIVSVSTEPPPSAVIALSAPFPNPARDRATIPLELGVPDHVHAELLDGQGRRVRLIVERSYSAGRHDIALDLEGLSSGLYFIRVRTSEGAATVPISVVR
ncbi:hypothetical protein BH23BAC4_BH23BAC4_00490 [soil metagenome]